MGSAHDQLKLFAREAEPPAPLDRSGCADSAGVRTIGSAPSSSSPAPAAVWRARVRLASAIPDIRPRSPDHSRLMMRWAQKISIRTPKPSLALIVWGKFLRNRY